MDPVGPWYASYNRLAQSNCAGATFQSPTANTSSDFVSHLSSTVPSTTTSPLLLQAAHTTASLAGQPSPFNPGGFLSPPPVSYDVFTPLFHKQPHYVAPHRQVQPDKQGSPENYSTAHQNATFFEHQTIPTTVPSLAWSQNSAQLPSPFGILPHESVVPSSPGPPAIKSSPTNYETFNSHFPTNQPINNIVSPEFKSNSYIDDKKSSRSESPVVKSIISPANADNQTFFQQVSGSFDSNGIANDYTTNNSNVKVQPLQQSCIVSTPNKDYRTPQTLTRTCSSSAIFLNSNNQTTNQAIPEKPTRFASPPIKSSPVTQAVQTKTQAKIYPEVVSQNDPRRTDGHESGSSQSSPISFSMMDSRSLSYATNNGTNNNNNCTNAINKQPFHVLAQQQPTPTYRQYSTGSTSDSEYHHSGRSKSAASTDSAYSSNTSTQNGPDCGVVVPRRSSPLQAHSQASPLGHVPSPAYPMYNSPMAMSSPSPLQQHGDSNGNQCTATGYKATVPQQVAPPSPLDVTLPRPPSQGHGQVAYSSVITRALATESNKITYSADSRSYERHPDYIEKQQVCWELDARQNRKFPVTTYATSNPDLSQTQGIPQPQPSQMQRLIGVPERQQPYFDSNQMSLQDLSSNRGDPMSIVKNLQQQGSCQMQQQHQQSGIDMEDQKQVDDLRKTAESLNKKRKSFDKTSHGSPLNETTGSGVITDYVGRIPPPAHHNANQQQQQNGGYFDFDRWNLSAPPPASKIFSSGTGNFSSQSTLHHSTNFRSNPAHQNQPQSLMVGHHHAPPPMSYLPPFHIPPGHHSHHITQEFQSSVDLGPIGFMENNGQQGTAGFVQEQREDPQPKVIIVPNIEEELEFLTQGLEGIDSPIVTNKDTKPKDPNTGFMASYLKFLQGERDPSPPPAMRGGRKAAWSRSQPYFSTEAHRHTDHANGVSSKVQEKSQSKDAPTIDYANDPRYFPLPKERKAQNFDSSDDGFTSDDDFPFSTKKKEKKQANITPSNNGNVNNVKVEIPPIKPEGKPKKGRPIKPGGPTDRKRKALAAAAAAAIAQGLDPNTVLNAKPPKKIDEVLSQLPRRELSKRKAKEKKLLDSQQENDYFDNEEDQDSDSDPAWTPAVKLTGDEDEKKKRRGRPVISKRSRKFFDESEYSSNEVVPKKVGRKKLDSSLKNTNNSQKMTCKINEKLLASIDDQDIDISPFSSGDFLVIKSELSEEFPAMWRIDGKTLLQKYVPFTSTNGRTLYRNISTYSGWATQNRDIYIQVPVKFWQQNESETIVEFLRDEVMLTDSDYIQKSMKEAEKYQDNFAVYIQTLMSQALDSNFLTEIFQEQDDYFLSNVKTVDDVTEELKQRLLSTTEWHEHFVKALSTWPCINFSKEFTTSEINRSCAACQHNQVYARVILYGQPYNSTTLEGSPPDLQVPHDKNFLLCRKCQAKVDLYNKVAHQKYLMFLECARRVAEKRNADPRKNTTIILNELLEDEIWLDQLFKNVRTNWAEIESMVNQIRMNQSGHVSSAVNVFQESESPQIHSSSNQIALLSQ